MQKTTKRGKPSKEVLESKARLSKIKNFVPQDVSYDKTDSEKPSAHFLRYAAQSLSTQFAPIKDGTVRGFPIIFRDNGEPWDLGNLYLMYKFNQMAKAGGVNVKTLTNKAKHLAMFLRWIEHNRSLGHDLHELHFPERPQERVTYRYHRYLKRLLRARPQPIGAGVAKIRMATVVDFYRRLVEGEMIAPTEIENPAYESKIAGIPITNRIGLQYIKQVETTDLAFHLPRRETEQGCINDGEKLRPLTDFEQDVILAALDDSGNRAFELMIWVALATGARKQTVCTLRTGAIRELYKNRAEGDKELLLRVGNQTDVDVKYKANGAQYRLHIPVELAKHLLAYADGDEAKHRREKSFYGDTDNNYLFLTRDGTPYYTSEREIWDRQDPKFSHRISMKERLEFTVSEGQSLNALIGRLIKKIRLRYPKFSRFSVHDLRATFGMNFVRDGMKNGLISKDLLPMLKIRMNHASVETTFHYLNFDSENERMDQVVAAHFDRLKRYMDKDLDNDHA